MLMPEGQARLVLSENRRKPGWAGLEFGEHGEEQEESMVARKGH